MGVLLAAGLLAGLAAAAFFAASEAAQAAAAPPADERRTHAVAFGHLLAMAWTASMAWLLVATGWGSHPAEPAAVSWQWWIALIAGGGFLLHVLGEQLPRALAAERAATWTRVAGPVLGAWSAAVRPLAAAASVLGGALRRAAGPLQAEEPITSREIQQLVAETSERAEIDPGERQMITSIFTFGDTTAREVMTPRTDVVGIEIGVGIEEAIARVRVAEHSRLPVYRGTLDDVAGVLYAKDLLSVAHGWIPAPASLDPLVREATVVPEGKKIDELLRQFQRERIHMALVVDEYGGTAGIVTLEDILEELVGEIQDEYDHEPPLIVPLHDGALRVDGRLDADDFNDLTDAGLDTEGPVETVGGLVAREVGRVPAVGEAVRIGTWWFLVEEMDRKRVTRLKAWREEPPEAAPAP